MRGVLATPARFPPRDTHTSTLKRALIRRRRPCNLRPEEKSQRTARRQLLPVVVLRRSSPRAPRRGARPTHHVDAHHAQAPDDGRLKKVRHFFDALAAPLPRRPRVLGSAVGILRPPPLPLPLVVVPLLLLLAGESLLPGVALILALLVDVGVVITAPVEEQLRHVVAVAVDDIIVALRIPRREVNELRHGQRRAHVLEQV